MANQLRARFDAPPAPASAPSWPNEHADRGYVLCFTGRCGSSHLIDLLAQSGLCGTPDEFFNEGFLDGEAAAWRSREVAGYVAQLVARRSSGRRFGFKIDGLRHRWLSAIADPLALFPPATFNYVYMTRRNLIEQAYSYAHAKLGGAWHRRSDSAEAPGSHDPAAIDDAALWREIAILFAHETHFEQHFARHSLPVQRIDYEMLCASEGFVVGTMMLAAARTLDEVGATLATLRPRHMKIDYAPAKSRRLLAFREKHAEPLAFLAAQRGHPMSDALRAFFHRLTRIDIAAL